ncbi:hypothetical protein C8J55DRAFT_459039, partial [Lentinula edodes]
MLFFHRQLFFLLCFASFALANTEIVNFEASDQIDVHIFDDHNWHVLSPGANEKSFNVQPAPFGTRMNVVCSSPQELLSKAPNCSNEIWIKLDLDHPDWKSYTKFTLRISWPGSSPADFGMNIFNPETTASRFAGKPISPPARTRVKFARIRVVDAGIISPLSGVTEVRPVPFLVILEPLYFGLIPASIVPFLWVLLPTVFVSIRVAPYANAFLSDIAAAARREITGKEE